MRGIELIGHRGASFDAPENTLAAFRLAWEQGADGIEGDFRLTRDGEIVCLHDSTTRRTAGRNLAVAGATLAELRALDAGAQKGEAWAGERIPTLREVIATVPPGKRLFIELKSGPEILLPLAAILAEPGLAPEQAVILSFSDEVVAQSRQLLPEVKALWITDYKRDWHCGGWSPAIGEVLRTLERIGATGLASRAHRSIDAAFVRALHSAGMELHAWTVDAPRTAARFLALGADSIFTNRPGWLRERLPSVPREKACSGAP
ncbi:MAG TPA: glycerophosphodiester phosphodiesterase [Geobacteraceae bacterium]